MEDQADLKVEIHIREDGQVLRTINNLMPSELVFAVKGSHQTNKNIVTIIQIS